MPHISRKRTIAVAVVVLAVCLAAVAGVRIVNRVGGLTTPDDGDVGHTDPPTPAAAIPSFSHVYVILLENHAFGAVMNGQAPYLSSLAASYGLATHYVAVAHPSQPNYLALFSGNTQGVTDDGVHDITAPNLVDRLEAAGRSWHVYAENVPDGCFTGAESAAGRTDPEPTPASTSPQSASRTSAPTRRAAPRSRTCRPLTRPWPSSS